jgi:hypothetical protein
LTVAARVPDRRGYYNRELRNSVVLTFCKNTHINALRLRRGMETGK